MIGTYPTVGCLILIDKLCFNSLKDTLQAFQALIPGGQEAASPVSRGEAALGGGMHPMLLLVQEANKQGSDKMVAVHIEFDEEEVMHLARQTGLSYEQLFMPYVQAAKSVPGVLAVGIGFELSPPSDLLTETVQDAGIAVLFARDEDHKSWSRRQTMPLVGHDY